MQQYALTNKLSEWLKAISNFQPVYKTSIRKDGTLIGFSDFETDFVLDDNILQLGKTTHGGLNIKKLIFTKDFDLHPLTFCTLYHLEEFVVNENSQKYSAIDGVLFSKDKKVLISFPQGKILDKYVIPEGVEVIGENAFQRTCVAEIVLPQTLKKIEPDAFIESNIYILNYANTTFNKLGARALKDCGTTFVVRNKELILEKVYTETGNWGKYCRFVSPIYLDFIREAIFNLTDLKEVVKAIDENKGDEK